MLSHAVTLTFDLLTLNFTALRVSWA